ncbi:phage tail protein [Streptomyces sp. NPDC049555]|uniref:phage tail protein n=1 Tax=Streptomyces sp. NPDC049555 TaxID=3154930 RepID=UPI00342E6D68
MRQVLPTGEVAVRAMPASRLTGEITITRRMDKSTAFTDWIKSTLVNADLDNARQDITLVLKDASQHTLKRVHLHNAWASWWEGPQLADGERTESVTIAYENITTE